MTTPTPQAPQPPRTPQFGPAAPTGWDPAGWGPAPAHFGPPPQPGKPSRGKAVITHGLVAVVALGLGAGLGSSAAGANDNAATAVPTVTRSAAPVPTVTATKPGTAAAPKQQPKPTGATSQSAAKVSGDGTYLVGQDMEPGTYKTKGPATGSLCYWERAKDSSGEFTSIITNATPTGTARVTVNKGEVFKTQSCQDWTKVD